MRVFPATDCSFTHVSVAVLGEAIACQLSPPFVVRRIVPDRPTAAPIESDRKSMLLSELSVLLSCTPHPAPPGSLAVCVRTTVPSLPTAQPKSESTQSIATRLVEVPESM